MDAFDAPSALFRFALRLLYELFYELFFSLICWCVGWVVCRAVTLNRYPRERLRDWEEGEHLGVKLVGLISIVALIWLVVVL